MSKLICLWFIFFSICGTYCVRNNVCKSFLAYNFKDFSDKCYYDPDADTKDITTVIKRHTGKVESYYVTTEDGYILSVYRIPRENPKGIIWLQHPITSDSTVWIAQSNNSLAFRLYEAGYDIWLPNHRGTTFSRGHLNLTTKEFSYWNWSFHEIGIYDFKAFAEFIAEKTGRNDVVFIGHSMASTSSLIYASAYPEEATKYVKVFVNMATPAYFKHVPLYIRAFAPLEIILSPITRFLKIGALLTEQNAVIKLVLAIGIYYPLNALIYFLTDITVGYTYGMQDPQSFQLLLTKLPGGLSFKLLYHFAQLARTENKFRQYNYGHKNVDIYGSEEPPEYSLDEIKAQFHWIYSDSDIVATEKDNEELYRKLPGSVKKYGVYKLKKFNHVDYFVGKNISSLYDYLQELISTEIFKQQ